MKQVNFSFLRQPEKFIGNIINYEEFVSIQISLPVKALLAERQWERPAFFIAENIYKVKTNAAENKA
ncbi:hypothetical protein ACLFKQ_05420 [Myxosarcina sp. GI1(2024)]